MFENKKDCTKKERKENTQIDEHEKVTAAKYALSVHIKKKTLTKHYINCTIFVLKRRLSFKRCPIHSLFIYWHSKYQRY